MSRSDALIAATAAATTHTISVRRGEVDGTDGSLTAWPCRAGSQKKVHIDDLPLAGILSTTSPVQPLFREGCLQSARHGSSWRAFLYFVGCLVAAYLAPVLIVLGATVPWLQW